MKKSVILCVDDEKMVLNSLKTELRESFGETHIIEVSENPEEAIEILENLLDEGYDVPLIISDYIMPNMKGDELLKHFRNRSPKTYTVMLTGQATTEGITNAVNWAHLYRYIGKPWESKDLELTVREAIKSYNQDKQLENKNKQLKLLNEVLETKIEERTLEIQTKNQILEKQKNELDFKNRHITDSIKAAFKIQQAMLPSTETLQSVFPNHFVVFKPKDIVSGDFFWCKQTKDQIHFAAADCTGHGVPGALMSMLGITFLNDIVAAQNTKNPAEILFELRLKIKQLLNQDSNIISQDGMDIAFCSIDLNTNTLHYAGAFNPLYLIRKSNNNSFELIERKGDRMPIGVYPKDSAMFTNHEIQLQPCDSIYIFSDGYISQFGGDRGNRIQTKKFKEILMSFQTKSMSEQKNILEDFFVRWQKNIEQVDDVLVIGIRICEKLLKE